MLHQEMEAKFQEIRHYHTQLCQNQPGDTLNYAEFPRLNIQLKPKVSSKKKNTLKIFFEHH